MAVKTTSTEIPYGETPLKLETGKLARQASGAVMVSHGETVILVTAVVAEKAREGGDFFPLTVDYEERMYAAGKISGSKFIKRENRPSEEAILKGRLTDRAIRPMFPKTFRHDVQVIVTILSYDEIHDPAAMAVVGASAALMQTTAPFNGPIGAVRVGQVDGQFIANPTEEQLEQSDLDLLAAGSEQKITMIEAMGDQIPDDRMLEALQFAHQEIIKTLEPQKVFVNPDRSSETYEEPTVYGEVREFVKNKIKEVVTQTESSARHKLLDALEAEAVAHFESAYDAGSVKEAVGSAFHKAIQKLILKDKKRPDGRAMDEIRPISIEVGVLPRVHGSALFSRGETQALTVATLGGPGEEQWIDTMEELSKKRYMHHYNFPPYSTGEVKQLRGGNRREIGHGALAEKALVPVIPSKEEFPYTIRLVSEILGSNGSSSMAAATGSTLALMDAGVPIKEPVAGIAMGLVTGETDDEFQILMDLQGLEDFAGEMDFKITGTKTGITAIQLDVKNHGLTDEIIKATFAAAETGRLEILEKMKKVLPTHRAELSKYAPRIISTKIDPEKIGELIGPGGKTINKIIDAEGGREVLNIDIDDDGTVMITSLDSEKANRVKAIVEGIGRPVEVGQEFEGEIIQIVKDRNSGKEIGAIVQLTPNRDGMIHISALGSGGFVQNVSDVVKVGEKVKVRVKAVDAEKGRISLTKI